MSDIAERLRACPFCGNTNPFIEGHAGARYVTCNNDLCQASIMPQETDEKAVAAWNKRPDADEIDRLKRERDERAEWAKAWHDTLETLATIHGLGILDRDEVIPAFGRYVDGIKDRAHSAEDEIDRLRAALKAIELFPKHSREDHWSNALDMAKMARAALNHEGKA